MATKFKKLEPIPDRTPFNQALSPEVDISTQSFGYITLPWMLWFKRLQYFLNSLVDNSYFVTTVDLADPITTGTDLANHFYVNIGSDSFVELEEWSITTKTAGDFEVDMLYSDDSGSSWTSLFSGGTLPSITAPATTATGAGFVTTELQPDWLLRYDVTTVSGVPGISEFKIRGRVV